MASTVSQLHFLTPKMPRSPYCRGFAGVASFLCTFSGGELGIRTLGEFPHTAFRVFSSLGQYRSIHDIFWLFCPLKNGVKWGFLSIHFSRNPHFARFKSFFSSALICRKNCTLGRTLDRTKQLQAFVAIHEGGRFFTRQNLFMRCF